jgi:hypothetical protein
LHLTKPAVLQVNAKRCGAKATGKVLVAYFGDVAERLEQDRDRRCHPQRLWLADAAAAELLSDPPEGSRQDRWQFETRLWSATPWLAGTEGLGFLIRLPAIQDLHLAAVRQVLVIFSPPAFSKTLTAPQLTFAAAASCCLGCVAAVTRLADSIPTRRLIAIASLPGVPFHVLALLKCSRYAVPHSLSRCSSQRGHGLGMGFLLT